MWNKMLTFLRNTQKCILPGNMDPKMDPPKKYRFFEENPEMEQNVYFLRKTRKWTRLSCHTK